jgi:hypothetical protein
LAATGDNGKAGAQPAFSHQWSAMDAVRLDPASQANAGMITGAVQW